MPFNLKTMKFLILFLQLDILGSCSYLKYKPDVLLENNPKKNLN
ncbi:hypothetical protein CLV48_10978 [Cecembia rubra]|uniref:Uncharacterized protein n=1 Tax=Cecembia rubra TaxID=1485585 RepID=A0A2P8DZH7_9BACT|nr:hypothetical protein CLV48_10978 [Cecembia rubra]